MIVVLNGRAHETGRVRIDDLPAWHLAHPGLVAVGTMTIDGEAQWPPAVVYEDEERGDAAAD